MKELLTEEKTLLAYLPKGEKMWAIALPCSLELTKDGLPCVKNPETRVTLRKFRVERDLGVYTAKYGNHVFYLGTFQNPLGGKFKLYSFPVKHKEREECDATLVMKSCEDLVAMCDKHGVSVCLLPQLEAKMDYLSFKNCYRDYINLILDDRFVMVHRKES